MDTNERGRQAEDATVRLKAGTDGGSAEPATGNPGKAAGALRSGGSQAQNGDPMVGQLVAGRYRLIAPLATGGMGSVYRAEQINLHRQVAVKIMVEPGEELIERYRREAVALSEVTHPAIVEIFDFDTYGEGIDARGCLVMAYIDGHDLADYLATKPLGYLEPAEVRSLTLPIVSALVELHANGIIHRDIKPDNIVRFVRADGRAGVKLVDFGIARRQLDQGMTASGYVLGTPPYLPPETMLGEKHTPLADIYALGATMFELLTGTPPYGHGSAAEIMQKALASKVTFPPELEETPLGQLLRRMLSRRPTQRPDAMEVLQRLEAIRPQEAGAAPSKEVGAARPTRPLPTRAAFSAGGAAQTQRTAREQGEAAARAGRETRGRALPLLVALVLGGLIGAGIVALAMTLH